METELLAPAGDLEAGYSAFYYGADAIYLGLRRFSARAEAVNFDEADLDEITAYAHANGKKVYVALNTLLQENELPLLMEQLDLCVRTKIDALIVQDLGVARIIKKSFPSLTLHASTQLAVHNLSGALALKKLGFERVVLARELSLSEIRTIQQKSGLEIEVFIHGALCYSYSGLCSFSSMTTARSANRGKCVYACRSAYRLNNRLYHPFSMKDLALEKEVCQLKGLSLKIEGRKKNALYVGAVTDYYRRILDTGKVDTKLTDNLKQIFARPWTKLHFNGKNKDVIEPDYVGHRGLEIGRVEKIVKQQITVKPCYPIERYDGIQIDIPNTEKPFGFSAEQLFVNGKRVFQVQAGQSVTISLPPKSPFIPKNAKVYLSSSTRVKRSYPYEKPKKGQYKNRLPISVDVYLNDDCICAVCETTSVRVDSVLSLAKDITKVENAVQNSFMKTGDTFFDVMEVRLHNPNALFAPASVLNEVRRQLFELLSKEMKSEHVVPSLPKTDIKTQSNNQKPVWKIKTDQPHLFQSVDLTDISELIVVLSSHLKPSDLTGLPKEKIRLALPTVLRHEAPTKQIELFWNAGYTKWQIGNIGGLEMLPKKADVDLDDTMHILNTQAMAHAFEYGMSGVTFSVEDTKDNISYLAKHGDNTTLVVYQDVPLFISANCIRENACADCSRVPQMYELTNGKDKFMAYSKDCQTIVTKQTPFYIGTSCQNVPVTAYRMDFCHQNYTVEQIVRLVNQIKSHQTLKNSYTGNFLKNFA